MWGNDRRSRRGRVLVNEENLVTSTRSNYVVDIDDGGIVIDIGGDFARIMPR